MPITRFIFLKAMNVTHLDARNLARALGGETSGNRVRAPGPGHSPHDRCCPDGFAVHSFADDDPIACRDYVREKAGLPPFKPNGQSRRPDADVIEGAVRAAARSQRENKPSQYVVAEYFYKQADGSNYLRVQRTNQKNFWQSHWTDAGWARGKPEGPKIPYRLPDILKYPYANIFIVEGEKDADRLALFDLVATTASEGASTPWAPELNQYFQGRDVFIIPDADEVGADHAQDVAKNLHGVATTVKIVQLPLGSKDVSDWLDADGTVEKLGDLCLDAPKWNPETKADEVPCSGTEQIESEPLPFLDMSNWDEQSAPPREWAVFERIPLRQVSLLSGEGAVGKSILEMQRCAAHALGRDWLGTLPEQGPAIIFNAEDEKDELHCRLARVAEFYGVTFTNLIKGGLCIVSLAGQDAVLGHADRHGIVKPTSLFTRLHEAARDIKPKTITLDTSADIFAGNENDRAQVRQFVGLLRGLAIDTNSAVLVCSHPSLTGISSDTGLSGSTAWHNSVRARLYFKPATTEAGETPDPDLRELQFKKNNYGPLSERVLLRWRNGVFVPVPSEGSLERMAADQKDDEMFLTLLVSLNEQGRNASPSANSSTFAPTLMKQDPRAQGISKRRLIDAMNRLFAARKIRVEPYGRPSRPNHRIVKI